MITVLEDRTCAWVCVVHVASLVSVPLGAVRVGVFLGTPFTNTRAQGFRPPTDHPEERVLGSETKVPR